MFASVGNHFHNSWRLERLIHKLNLSNTTQSIALVLVSVALFALLSLVAKLLGTNTLGPPLHPMQISAARFIIAFMVLTTVFVFKPIPFAQVPWGLHLRRGIAGWCGVTCLFAAAILIPLADATAISFLSIIVTMALSIWMLKEKAGPRRWIAATIALAGALLITRPGTSAFQPVALVAFLAAIFIGFEIIFIKQLSGREPLMRILFINNLIGASISASVVGFVWQAPSAQQWFLIIAIGVLMLAVQATNILAMRRSDASFVAPFWFATPAFAALFDYLVFSQFISLTSGIGILLIVFAGVFISWREQKTRQST
ncbi:MAG: DMT family transporter [Pseudomonadota bacterium]